jgi:2-amino-4-hydroxy-6-hydroxymethyldihydropteridine diphosphokinase
MNKAYLLIGGNLGDRLQNLSEARKRISESCGDISKMSGIYETAAWGIGSQPDFLNQAILLKTDLPPLELLKKLLETELQMGRVRLEKNGPRTIDIDILLYNDRIMTGPGLEIPHPRMHLRRFVLTPLAEISPRKKHPQLGLTITELLDRCPDPLTVTRYSTDVQKKP